MCNRNSELIGILASMVRYSQDYTVYIILVVVLAYAYVSFLYLDTELVIFDFQQPQCCIVVI